MESNVSSTADLAGSAVDGVVALAEETKKAVARAEETKKGRSWLRRLMLLALIGIGLAIVAKMMSERAQQQPATSLEDELRTNSTATKPLEPATN